MSVPMWWPTWALSCAESSPANMETEVGVVGVSIGTIRLQQQWQVITWLPHASTTSTAMAGYYTASSYNNINNNNGRLLHGFLMQQQHQQQQRQVITASLVQIRRVRGWFTPWKRAFTRWLGFLSVHLRVKYFSKRVRYAHIKIPARTFYRLVSFAHKKWCTLATLFNSAC